MWAGNLVRARLLARKGIVDPADFASILAWRLEKGGNGNLYSPTANPIVQGSISSQTGGESDSATRLRCEGYIKVEPNTAYTYESNVPRMFVIEYSEINTKPIDSSGWVAMPKTLTTSENTNYIRFTLAATGNAEITVDDFEWMRITKADISSGTYSVMRMMAESDGEEFDYFEE